MNLGPVGPALWADPARLLRHRRLGPRLRTASPTLRCPITAAKQLGFAPERAVVVEDTAMGVEAAKPGYGGQSTSTAATTPTCWPTRGGYRMVRALDDVDVAGHCGGTRGEDAVSHPRTYETAAIRVHWDSSRCVHTAAACNRCRRCSTSAGVPGSTSRPPPMPSPVRPPVADWTLATSASTPPSKSRRSGRRQLV